MSGDKRESAEEGLVRWKKLELLQAHYPDFEPFLEDMMAELGFETDDIQKDIADFMENGPLYLMVQAQRGQAKTTIASIFAVWCLIHNPRLRILVVSAGEGMASQISTFIVRMIMTVDVLEPLRPDKSAGDKTSTSEFDVHHSLKGLEKSPSVVSLGVTSNIQGYRADLLLADDVESGKNSRTSIQREVLMQIIRDFWSINSTGRILFLGTPQSVDSVYNAMPQMGVEVRIWPGRYPNQTQLESYGDNLAPLIKERLLKDPTLGTGMGMDGDLGKATSPVIVSEEKLIMKETAQGQAFFQLQHMLLTALSDAARFPLKVNKLIVSNWQGKFVPLEIVRNFSENRTFNIGTKRYTIGIAGVEGTKGVGKISSSVFYIDPAGGGENADETAYAHVGLMNSALYLDMIGGVKGGYDEPQLRRLARLSVQANPTVIKIEKNFGFGAFKPVFTPIMRQEFEKAGLPVPGIEDDYVTGQKEIRIIETLEPVIGRGSLIVHEDILEADFASIQAYPLEKRDTYSFFFQLAKLTRDRNSLFHDDRIDALEGGVRHFQNALAVDQKKALEAAERRAHEEMMRNPRGVPEYALKQRLPTQRGLQHRVRRI